MALSSLLTNVEAALGLSVDLGYASKGKDHDLYEAYVLTLLLRAADVAGWKFELRDGWGNAITAPLFRLGPGRITSRNYTFARMTKAGRAPLEAHLGVKVSGQAPVGISPPTKSGRLLHEFDLVVLPESIASACRATGGDPDHTAVTIHAEMKFYTGKLSLPLGRASIGMALECGLSGKSALITNQLGYTVQDLVQHHSVAFRFNVLPSNSTAEWHVTRWFSTFL
ncbi:MAG: hypothetical protein EKK31_04330 [Hyphomicrobiales bacterium]|nr:MAG: hypothetical protein EKK31_04330 [Hyphomicrobiales bacterium]